MKRLPVLAALVLSATVCGSALAQQSAPAPAGAQGNPPGASQQHMHKFDAETQLQRLTKQLVLTPDQQTRLRPILEQRDQQLQALHGDTSLKPADRRAKVQSIMQDSENQISGVLTQEQNDKWKAMREKAMERMQDKRGDKVPSSTASNGG